MKSRTYCVVPFCQTFGAMMASFLLARPAAQAAGGSWAVDADGNWSEAANWSSAAVPGTTAGDIVAFTNNITAARSITIDDTSRTVGVLIVGDPVSSYFNFMLEASGGAGLTFNNNGSPAYLIQVNNTTAADSLAVPLTLTDHLTVTNRATLTLSGDIAGSGKRVTKTGSGTLILSGANTYSGGTTITGGGTLQLGAADALPTAGAVVLGGTNSMGNLNLGAFSQRLAGLTALSTSSLVNNQVTVGTGQTLTINGTTGLFVGTDAGAGSTTKVTMPGGGALVVTNASAYVTVGKTQASQSYSNTGSLDLSALSDVTLGSSVVPVNEIRLAYGQTCTGTLTLSDINNLLTANILHVANSVSWNAGTGTLILGAGTNVLAVNTIHIGLVKATGTMKFASQTAGSSGTVTIGGKTGGTTDFNIGSKNALASGAVPSGTLDLRGHVVDVSAGTVTIGREDNSSTSIYTGGASGSLLFDAGSFSVNNLIMAYKSGPNTGASAKATATLTLGGGTFTVNNSPITLATQTGAGFPGCANATLNLNGGTFRSYADICTGLSNCLSTINLDGGTLDMTGHSIGLNSQTVTVFNARSGTLMNVGEFNNGALLIKSGSDELTLAGTNAYTGATVINSGTLTLGEGCQLGSGNYAAEIINNAALVFNSGVSQTLSGRISGSGALTKSGDGTLTLVGTNTYSGATAVTAGSLIGVAGGALDNSDVTVSSGAALGVRVLADDAQWGCKSLTLDTGSATVEFLFQGATPSAAQAPLLVNGDLVNGGTLNVTVSGVNAAVGTYPLIAYTGTLTEGVLGSVSLPNGGVGSLVNNTAEKTIDLSVTTAGSSLIWDGGSGDWDIGTTANWSGGLTYIEGDIVRFDDTSSGTAPFTVNLTTALNPGGVVVDNTAKDYTFSGVGSLGGEGALTKRGTGALTLSGFHTYNGGTTLDDAAGTVSAAISATQSGIGSGPVAIGAGSTLSLDNGNTSAASVSKANVFTGTGLLKVTFAADATVRSTVFPGLSGFAGTVQLTGVSGTGDKWDAGDVDAPDAAVQIGSGNTLLVGGTTTRFDSIAVQGAGNAEGKGAIRLGVNAVALDGAITLSGDTTIASDSAAAALSGSIVGTAATDATNVLTLGTSASAAGCVLSGAIGDGTSGGKVALTQTKGTLTLSGANTYGGLTTINGGSTLQLGAADTLPTSGSVVLGDASGVGNIVLGSFSQTLGSLTVSSTNSATTDGITFDSGPTLTLAGPGGLFVGTDVGASSTTQLKLSGGGALMMTNASANVTVGKSQSDEVGNNTCSLDLSDLSAVILGSGASPINEIRIAYGQYCPGAVVLSNTSNLITAATLNIGNSNGYVPAGSGTMTLGAGANILAVNKINIGQSKGVGTLSFASQTAGSSGRVTICNKTGGPATLSIGDKTGTWTAATPIGTLDLRGHLAEVTAGTVTIGKEDHQAIKESGATGYLYFDSGTFTATNLLMGIKTGFNTGVLARASGTLTVSGGVFTVTSSNAFTFGYQSGAGYASATLNLLGGTFRSYSNLLTGPSNCTSTVNLNGGTLDMTGCAIGLNAQTVTVFNARSGTLMNLGAFNNGMPLVKSGTGTLTLDGTNTYAGVTVVSNGVLRLTGGVCLPPTADLYVFTGGTVQLDYAGSLYIHALYIDGVRKRGMRYGQSNLPAFFSGEGYIVLPYQGTLLRCQ